MQINSAAQCFDSSQSIRLATAARLCQYASVDALLHDLNSFIPFKAPKYTRKHKLSMQGKKREDSLQ